MPLPVNHVYRALLVVIKIRKPPLSARIVCRVHSKALSDRRLVCLALLVNSRIVVPNCLASRAPPPIMSIVPAHPSVNNARLVPSIPILVVPRVRYAALVPILHPMLPHNACHVLAALLSPPMDKPNALPVPLVILQRMLVRVNALLACRALIPMSLAPPNAIHANPVPLNQAPLNPPVWHAGWDYIKALHNNRPASLVHKDNIKISLDKHNAPTVLVAHISH